MSLDDGCYETVNFCSLSKLKSFVFNLVLSFNFVRKQEIGFAHNKLHYAVEKISWSAYRQVLVYKIVLDYK